MKFEKISDDVTRVVVIEVEGAEPTQVRYGHWSYIPDRVTVKICNGALLGVTVSGARLLKSGQPSEKTRAYDIWTPGATFGEQAPSWLHDLVASVLYGGEIQSAEEDG